jgi:chitinase
MVSDQSQLRGFWHTWTHPTNVIGRGGDGIADLLRSHVINFWLAAADRGSKVKDIRAVIWLDDIFAYGSRNKRHPALRSSFTYVTAAVKVEITVQGLVYEINEHYNKLLVP